VAKLPRCTARQFARALERAGFTLRRQTGSHATYKNEDGRMVTVPMHGGDLRTPTVAAMLKASGMTADELRAFL
jgi:predicted RNA binding protein YcfA (HicA-like mRNA interferase family)